MIKISSVGDEFGNFNTCKMNTCLEYDCRFMVTRFISKSSGLGGDRAIVYSPLMTRETHVELEVTLLKVTKKMCDKHVYVFA